MLRALAQHPRSRSRSLRAVSNQPASPDAPDEPIGPAPGAPGPDGPARAGERGSLDGVSSFMGLRWDDPETVRLTIRPELINRGGLLSGVVSFALVDYCMGSTLWAQTTAEERIATINISINYIQTATSGDVICKTVLDRRNRTIGVMKSSVHAEDGRLLATAVGSYSIFAAKRRVRSGPTKSD